MRIDDIKKEINKLALTEKLLLVEDVWDEIGKSNAQLTMPEWQIKALDLRIKDYEDGNLETVEWGEVHKGLREKYK